MNEITVEEIEENQMEVKEVEENRNRKTLDANEATHTPQQIRTRHRLAQLSSRELAREYRVDAEGGAEGLEGGAEAAVAGEDEVCAYPT